MIREWNVTAVRGHAGGSRKGAGATLEIECKSDTVEEIRTMVEATPDLLRALLDAILVFDSGMETLTAEAVDGWRNLASKAQGAS